MGSRPRRISAWKLRPPRLRLAVRSLPRLWAGAATLVLVAVIPAAAQDAAGGQDAAAAAQDRLSGSVRILPDAPVGVPATPAPAIPAVRLDLLNSTLKVDNAAGVALDLIPNLEVNAGSKLGFRITTRKAGYLILLDVDATGKLTQIFPSTATISHLSRDAPNLLKPGRPLTIPQLGSPYAGFEFIAEPPAGVAMVVALLSDKPVQVVDLPDAPPPAAAPGETLKYVRDQARTLKIPSPDNGQLEQPNWSFDGKFYLIK